MSGHDEPREDADDARQDAPTGDPTTADASRVVAGDGDVGVDTTERRDPRLRPVAMILGVGLGLAVLGAIGVGVAGGSGRAGAAVLLLVLTLSLAAGALTALGTALVDEVRGHSVGRARIVVGIVLFVAAAAFMAMTAGIGG